MAQIMTADGWKDIKDFQSIKATDTVTTFSQALRKIHRDVFCGFSPTPNGIMSGANLHDFNIRAHNQAIELCKKLGVTAGVPGLRNESAPERVGLRPRA